jgi:hypothetical protein
MIGTDLRAQETQDMSNRPGLFSTGVAGLLCGLFTPLATAELPASVSSGIDAVMPDVVAWRRDLHEHPELGNQEFRTAPSWPSISNPSAWKYVPG